MLTEKFVQQYVTDCIALPDKDFDSDHRILITEMKTPKTKKARWNERKQNIVNSIPNTKLLKDSYYQELFTDSIEDELRKLPNSAESIDANSERILSVIDAAITNSIPAKTKVREEK